MKYVSTRGDAPARRFTEILLEGLAADGGLYVPEAFPRTDLKALRGMSYPDLALAILSKFMDDVPDLAAIVRKYLTRALAPPLPLLRLCGRWRKARLYTFGQWHCAPA